MGRIIAYTEQLFRKEKCKSVHPGWWAHCGESKTMVSEATKPQIPWPWLCAADSSMSLWAGIQNTSREGQGVNVTVTWWDNSTHAAWFNLCFMFHPKTEVPAGYMQKSVSCFLCASPEYSKLGKNRITVLPGGETELAIQASAVMTVCQSANPLAWLPPSSSALPAPVRNTVSVQKCPANASNF